MLEKFFVGNVLVVDSEVVIYEIFVFSDFFMEEVLCVNNGIFNVSVSICLVLYSGYQL